MIAHVRAWGQEKELKAKREAEEAKARAAEAAKKLAEKLGCHYNLQLL